MRWPPPPPGRVRWAWLLELGWRQRRVRKLLSMLDGRYPRGGLLLDVGGGTGVGARLAVERSPQGAFRRPVIVDAQKGMLARAARHRVPAELVCGDAVRLPIGDRTVDVLLSLGVLCCLAPEAVPAAVEESWRVLRPGGLAVVALPRWRGDDDSPIFRSRGFREVAHPRPGWTLFERPPGGPSDGTARP